MVPYIIERLTKEKEEQERLQLEEMSEDEYDALSDEQKAEIDRKRLDIKKERLRRCVLESVILQFFKCILHQAVFPNYI